MIVSQWLQVQVGGGAFGLFGAINVHAHEIVVFRGKHEQLPSRAFWIGVLNLRFKTLYSAFAK